MKVLIQKNVETNEVLSYQYIWDDNKNVSEIIDGVEPIEIRTTEVGSYQFDEQGKLVVIYTKLPPTLEQVVQEQEKIIADLMFEIAEIRKQQEQGGIS